MAVVRSAEASSSSRRPVTARASRYCCRARPGSGKRRCWNTWSRRHLIGRRPDGAVELEMKMDYADLQQLCGQLLDRLEMIPAPQRQAIGVVFGLSAGRPPDRFLLGEAGVSQNSNRCNHGNSCVVVGGGSAALSAEQPRVSRPQPRLALPVSGHNRARRRGSDACARTKDVISGLRPGRHVKPRRGEGGRGLRVEQHRCGARGCTRAAGLSNRRHRPR